MSKTRSKADEYKNLIAPQVLELIRQMQKVSKELLSEKPNSHNVG